MKRLLLIALPLSAVTVLLIVAASTPVTGQVTKGKTRPLTTHQLMGGLVRPNCADLGKGLKADNLDDEAWEALATKAALLNEAGHILMADGRCPDKTWADAAKTLRECSAVVLEKIDAKDAAGAQGAFAAMTKSCGACHKAHKK